MALQHTPWSGAVNYNRTPGAYDKVTAIFGVPFPCRRVEFLYEHNSQDMITEILTLDFRRIKIRHPQDDVPSDAYIAKLLLLAP